MSYVFAGKKTAAERLEKINKLFFPITKTFLQSQSHVSKKIISLVDLGCGPGYTTRALSSIINADRYIGLDNSKYFINQAMELSRDFPRITYKLHDVTSVPLPIKKADIIYLRFLLTHMPDPKRSVLEWSTHLNNGGLLLIEETEGIKTELSIFEDYMEISNALLKANGNVLYIGKMLDELKYGGKLKKKYSDVAKVSASTKQAAEIFLFNIPSWKNSEFIKDNYYDCVWEIEAELKEIVEVNDDRKTIEWEIRQIVLEKID